MEWFRAKMDEESIESLRRIQGKKSLLRLFFGAMGIVMFAFFFMFLGLVDRITADMDIDIVRRCAFAGFACGALFRLFAMLMVLQRVLALMKVCQRDQKSRHLMYLKSVLLMLILTLFTVELAAQHSPRTGALSLNGTWECALGTGAEQAWTPQGQAGLTWNTTTVPGNNLDTTGANISKIKFAWDRRDFTLTAQQAQQLVILYWDFVTLGASVYINGQFVGHNEPGRL